MSHQKVLRANTQPNTTTIRPRPWWPPAQLELNVINCMYVLLLRSCLLHVNTQEMIGKPQISVIFYFLSKTVCQWLATGQWFSPGTPVSSTNKTDHHNITEILLKVELNNINQTKIKWLFFLGVCWILDSFCFILIWLHSSYYEGNS